MATSYFACGRIAARWNILNLMSSANVLAASGLLISVLACAGCGSRDEIRSYDVPKNSGALAELPEASSAPSGPPTHRLLGAIVPHGDQTWYFKMTGPLEPMESQTDAFRGLVESVTFAGENDSPSWNLPTGWTQRDGTGQRLATLVVDVDGTELETTVIPLATMDTPTAILDNVNRWRKQMQLPAIADGELEEETSQVKLAGGTAVTVDLTGHLDDRGGNGRSMMSASSPTSGNSAAGADSPRFVKPDDWQEAPQDGFSRLAFAITKGDQSARVTVSVLGGDGGGTLNNINRWRNQIGVPPWDAAALENQAEKFSVGGIDGYYVEAAGPETETPSSAIYGWVGLSNGRSWFFKMRGDAELVQQQRDAFRAFLQSFEF
jgi:hypothetical protein